MKNSLNLFKYNLYLVTHKKVIIYLTMALTILLFVQSVNSILQTRDAFYLGNASVHNFMLTADYNRRIIFLAFIYVLPLITGLSLSDTWYSESKFTSYLLTRCSIKKFIIMKTIATFVAGFLVCFFPLMINYLCEYIILGESDTLFHYLLSIAPENNVEFLKALYPLYELYIRNPAQFICFYIILISSFGGLYSASTFCFSLLTKNKIVTYLGCFVASITVLLLCNVLPSPFDGYYIQSILNPYSTMEGSLLLVISAYSITFLAFIIGSIVLFVKRNRGEWIE